jgi:hypothetical protein
MIWIECLYFSIETLNSDFLVAVKRVEIIPDLLKKDSGR